VNILIFYEVIEILPNIEKNNLNHFGDVKGHRYLKLVVSGFQSNFLEILEHCQKLIVFLVLSHILYNCF